MSHGATTDVGMISPAKGIMKKSELIDLIYTLPEGKNSYREYILHCLKSEYIQGLTGSAADNFWDGLERTVLRYKHGSTDEERAFQENWEKE